MQNIGNFYKIIHFNHLNDKKINLLATEATY